MRPAFDVGVIERTLAPEEDGLSPALARHILRLGFARIDHRRMDQLNEKAQEGTLTRRETEELESYLLMAHFLAVLKSKARRSLKERGATP